MTKHFAIIGGGAAGLCAAEYLTARGIDAHPADVWCYAMTSSMPFRKRRPKTEIIAKSRQMILPPKA